MSDICQPSAGSINGEGPLAYESENHGAAHSYVVSYEVVNSEELIKRISAEPRSVMLGCVEASHSAKRGPGSAAWFFQYFFSVIFMTPFLLFW